MHGEGRGNRNALAFAAREGIDPAAPQRVNPDLIDHLLDALAHQRSGQSEILQAKGKLRLDVLEHELRIGMLKDEADVGCELTWRAAPRGPAAPPPPPPARPAPSGGQPAVPPAVAARANPT